MRALGFSLPLACLAALIVFSPNLAKSQPSVLPLTVGQKSAGGIEEVGYRYRRYRYARRPYHRPYYPYYRPYYRPYAYYRPYYRPYAYYRPYPYYYRPYFRPGFSFWFGF